VTPPPSWLIAATMAMATKVITAYSTAVAADWLAAKRRAAAAKRNGVLIRNVTFLVLLIVVPQSHKRSRNAILSGSSAGGMS
jgi:hypothetical protein